jgi:hypothetical protein
MMGFEDIGNGNLRSLDLRRSHGASVGEIIDIYASAGALEHCPFRKVHAKGRWDGLWKHQDHICRIPLEAHRG